jgi:hypothetical protein
MAGCAHCGGCCAACGASCGAFGGGLTALGPEGFGGGLAPGLDGDDGEHGDDAGQRDVGDQRDLGGNSNIDSLLFHPLFGSHRKKDEGAGTDNVDTQALADPHHPGHREAITAISHVDPEQHSRLMAWLNRN